MLDDEIHQWINMLTTTMQSKYKREMEFIINQISDFDKRLDRPITDLDDIRIIMETQKKMREMEIDMDIKIETVQLAFEMIFKHLARPGLGSALAW